MNYFSGIDANQFVNGGSKTTTITHLIDNYAAELVNGTLRLFVMIDYSPALIESFEFSFDDASTTVFSNDLISINCATTGE